MKPKKVYISGPISGLPREEYLARFAEAERWLTSRGFRVCNPCKLAPSRWPWLYRLIGYRLTLWYDIQHMKRCDKIAMLPEWTTSCGAMTELSSAMNTSHVVVFYDEDFNYHMYDFIDSRKETKHSTKNNS